MNACIVVVDDQKTQRDMLGRFLKKCGFTVHLAETAPAALAIVEKKTVDIVVSDQKMPGMSGLELAASIHALYPTVAVIIVTAFGSIDDAVTAMKEHVEDYITKPVDLDRLKELIDNIIEKQQRVRDNEALQEKLAAPLSFRGCIYESESMEAVMSRAARAAESHATVLVTGESGTGKELVARAIHECGARKDRNFVAVNCSALPETLIESELFGHEKGAFTGADRKHIGRFEQAEGGTLFLDEVGDIPPQVQVKLLRVLQEKCFERVGGRESLAADVRIVAATNRDLEAAIADGEFRDDLYFRLNVVHIDIPPLRKRKNDIPALTEHFLARYANEHGRDINAVSAEALDALVKYTFPGNVRELANIIEQAVVLSRGDTITKLDLPMRVSVDTDTGVEDGLSLDDKVARLEKQSIEKALNDSGGNKSAAARLLGISEHKVRYLMKKHGMTQG